MPFVFSKLETPQDNIFTATAEGELSEYDCITRKCGKYRNEQARYMPEMRTRADWKYIQME